MATKDMTEVLGGTQGLSPVGFLEGQEQEHCHAY